MKSWQVNKKLGLVKLSRVMIAALLVFVFFGGNMDFEGSALNKSNKAGKSQSVVNKRKTKKKSPKKKDSDVESNEERISKLEKRLQELEERVSQLGDKVFKELEDNGKNKKSGKKRKSKKDADTGWTWPVPGYHSISAGFDEKHGAIDIIGDSKNGSVYGATVVAANSGTVMIVCNNGYGGGYGNYVVIDHGDGKSTLYGHLRSVTVKKDQKISKGQEIGKAGSTGISTGPHLHFEYRVDGVRTDPSVILNY